MQKGLYRKWLNENFERRTKKNGYNVRAKIKEELDKEADLTPDMPYESRPAGNEPLSANDRLFCSVVAFGHSLMSHPRFNARTIHTPEGNKALTALDAIVADRAAQE